MKSMDQVMFGASGTASTSGLSRFSRLRGLIRRFSSVARFFPLAPNLFHQLYAMDERLKCKVVE